MIISPWKTGTINGLEYDLYTKENCLKSFEIDRIMLSKQICH